MQLDPFQVPDVLFISAEASGPRHNPVAATWQTHIKSNWQLASRLHHPDKPGRHFKGKQSEDKGRALRVTGTQVEPEAHSPELWLLDGPSNTGRRGFGSFQSRVVLLQTQPPP